MSELKRVMMTMTKINDFVSPRVIYRYDDVQKHLHIKCVSDCMLLSILTELQHNYEVQVHGSSPHHPLLVYSMTKAFSNILHVSG